MLAAALVALSPALAATPQDATADAQSDRAAAIDAGRTWLVEHQSKDGRWDCDGFESKAPVAPAEEWSLDEEIFGEPSKGRPVRTANGGGEPMHDLGVTGLSMIALMPPDDGQGLGPHAETVERAYRWILTQQDEGEGRFGEAVGHTFLYDHAIATLAVARWCRLNGEGYDIEPLQRAVNYIVRARNPYGVWRYDVPPTGDNDTSVTTWMTLALAESEAAGATIDRACAPDTIRWLDEMTDPDTGRIGYDERGSVSSRVPGINDQFPAEEHETLTAAGLLCRLVLGQTPRADRVLVEHVRLLIASLPDGGDERSPDALGAYFGARAMVQLGGRVRSEWESRSLAPLLAAQSTEEGLAGSWDPRGAWSYSFGRIGETALVTAALAVLEAGA